MRKNKGAGQYSDGDIYNYILSVDDDYPRIQPKFDVDTDNKIENDNHVIYKTNQDYVIYGYDFKNQTKYLDTNKQNQTLNTVTNIDKNGNIEIGDIGFCIIKTKFYETNNYAHDINQYTLKVLYPTNLSIDYDTYKEDNPSLKWDDTTEIVNCTESFDNNNNNIHTNVFARFPSTEYIKFQAEGINYNDSFKPDFRYWYNKDSIDKDGIVIFNPSTGTLSLKTEYIKNNQTVEIYSEVLESLDSFFTKSNSITHTVRFYKQLPMKYDIENNTQIIYLNEKIEKGLEEAEAEENKQMIVNGMSATGLTINFIDADYEPFSNPIELTLKDLSANYTFQESDYIKNGNSYQFDAHKVALNHKFKLTINAERYKLSKILGDTKNLTFDNVDEIVFTVSANPSTKQKAILINGMYFGKQNPDYLTTDNPNAISEYFSHGEDSTIDIQDIKFELAPAPKEYALIIINGWVQYSGYREFLNFELLGNARATVATSSGYEYSNENIEQLGDIFGGNYIKSKGSVVFRICKNYGYKYKINITGQNELNGLSDTVYFDTNNYNWVYKASRYQCTNDEIKDMDCCIAGNVYLRDNDGKLNIKLKSNTPTNYIGSGIQTTVYGQTQNELNTNNWKTIGSAVTDNNGNIKFSKINPEFKKIKITINTTNTSWRFLINNSYTNTFTFGISDSEDYSTGITMYHCGIENGNNVQLVNYNGNKKYAIIGQTKFPWMTGSSVGKYYKKYGNCIIQNNQGGDIFYRCTGFWRLPQGDSDWIGGNIYRESEDSGYTIQNLNGATWSCTGFYDTTAGNLYPKEIWYWTTNENAAVRFYDGTSPSFPKGSKVDFNANIGINTWRDTTFMQILLVRISGTSSYKTELVTLSSLELKQFNTDETVDNQYGAKSINYSSPSVISDIYSDDDEKEMIFGDSDSGISEFSPTETENNIEYKEEKEVEEEYGTIQIEEMPELILPNDISIAARNRVQYFSSNESVVSLVYYDYDPEFGVEKEISSYSEVDTENGHLLKPKLRVWNVGESMITASYEDDDNYAGNSIKYKVIVKSKKLPKITLDKNEFEITREVATIIDEDYDNPDPLSSNQTFQSPTPTVICEEDIPIHFDYSSSNNNIATHYSEGNMIISDVGTVKITITLRETAKFKTANVSYKLKIVPPKEKTKTILETEKSYYKVRFSEYTDKPVYRLYDIYGGEHQHLICEINSKSAFKKIKEGGLTLILRYKKKNIHEYIVNGIKYNLTYNDGITPYKYKNNTYYNTLEDFFSITDEANGKVQLFDTENVTYSEDLKNAYVKLNCSVVFNEDNIEAYYIFNKALQNRLDKDMNSFIKGTIPGTYIDKHLTPIIQEDESYIEWETWPIYSANFETYGIQTNGKAYKHIIEAELDELSHYGIGKYQYFGSSQYFVDITNANTDIDNLMVKHNYNDNDLRYQVFKCPFTSNNTDDDVEYTFTSSIPVVANPNDNGNVVIYKTGKVKIMINSTETANFTSAETGYILDVIAKDDPLLDTVYNKYIYYMDLNKLENVFTCPEFTWSNTDPDAKLIFRIHDGGDYTGTTWKWIDIDDIDDIPDNDDEDDLDDELPDTEDNPDNPDPETHTYYLTLEGINVGKITEQQYNIFKEDAIAEVSGDVVEIPNTKFNLVLNGKDGTPISDNTVINDYILNGRPAYTKIDLQFELDDGQYNIFHYQNEEGFIDFSITKNVDKYDISINMDMYPVLEATQQYVAYFLRRLVSENEAVGLENTVARTLHNWYYIDENCQMTGTGLDETYHCYSSCYEILYIETETGGKLEHISRRNWVDYKSAINLTPIAGTNSIIIGYEKGRDEEEEIIYGDGEPEGGEGGEGGESLPEGEEEVKLKLADFKTEITFADETTGEAITDDNGIALKAKIDSAGNITIDNGVTNRVIHVLIKSVETDNFNARYHVYNLLISPSMGSVEMLVENPIMDVRVNPDEILMEDIVIDKPTIQHKNTDGDVKFEYAIYIGDDNLKDNVLPWYATSFDAEQTRTGVDWEPSRRTGPLTSPRNLLPPEYEGIFSGIFGHIQHPMYSGNGYLRKLEGEDSFGHNYSIEIEHDTGIITLAKSGTYPPCNIVINVICFMYASEHFPEACIFYNYNILEKKDTHISMDTAIYTRLQPDVKELFTLPQIKTNNTDSAEIQYYVMVRDVGRVIHGNNTWIDDDGTEQTFIYQDGTSDTYWENAEGHYCYNYDTELNLVGGVGHEEDLKNLYTPANPYTLNSYPQTISGGLFEIRGNGSIIYSNASYRHVLNIWVFSKETTNYKKDSLFYNLEITVKEKPQLGVYPQKIIVRVSNSNAIEQYVESPKVTCTNTDSSHQLIYQFNKVQKTIGNTTYPAASGVYEEPPFTLDKVGNVIIADSATVGDKICVKLSCPSTKNYGYVETYYGIECKSKEEPYLDVQSSLNLTRTVTVGSEVFPGPTVKHNNTDKRINITYESSDTSVVCVTPKGALIVYKTGSATITIKIHESENFKEEQKTCTITITQQEIPAI